MRNEEWGGEWTKWMGGNSQRIKGIKRRGRKDIHNGFNGLNGFSEEEEPLPTYNHPAAVG